MKEFLIEGKKVNGGENMPNPFWIGGKGEDWVPVGAYEDFPGAGGNLDGRW
jgi:hypothetical protein